MDFKALEVNSQVTQMVSNCNQPRSLKQRRGEGGATWLLIWPGGWSRVYLRAVRMKWVPLCHEYVSGLTLQAETPSISRLQNLRGLCHWMHLAAGDKDSVTSTPGLEAAVPHDGGQGADKGA